MTKPKYQVGDRFTVMDTVEFKIIEVIGKKEPAYIFELLDNPMFKSVLTEQELDCVLKKRSFRLMSIALGASDRNIN